VEVVDFDRPAVGRNGAVAGSCALEQTPLHKRGTRTLGVTDKGLLDPTHRRVHGGGAHTRDRVQRCGLKEEVVSPLTVRSEGSRIVLVSAFHVPDTAPRPGGEHLDFRIVGRKAQGLFAGLSGPRRAFKLEPQECKQRPAVEAVGGAAHGGGGIALGGASETEFPLQTRAHEEQRRILRKQHETAVQ